jgi:hypothetical protein
MSHGRGGSDERGISPEGVAALGFGLTILMLAVVGAGLLQLDDSLSSNQPVISTTAEPVHGGTGLNDQWVRIHHDNGERIDVANITITVWLPDHRKRATLQNLPTDRLEQSNYGDNQNHIFTLGEYGIEGPLETNANDNTWTAGETIGVRLSHERVPLEPGQRVEVTIRHTPTDATLVETTLTVQE